MERTVFGKLPDGQAVERVRLRGGGLTADVLNYGAVLQDLRLDGHEPPLVLGFARLDHYRQHGRYFGATVGRCANRIAGARFTLDGQDYQLAPNEFGRQQLHGGSPAMSERLWTFEEVEPQAATLTIELADGDMGYPGALTAQVRFSVLPEGLLDIRLRATATKATLCNLAHHSYWNLTGEADILGHQLAVAAEHYLPVDTDLIPTGAVAPVAGTAFDFRGGVRLGAVCTKQRVDHNFCLSRARVPIRDVARLTGGGIAMRLRTTEPGVQVFDGAPLAVPVPCLDGRVRGAYPGIALEPQVWPDAIHHPDWPQPVLRPGETYDQHSQFVFARAM
ncbi:MAG: aldose epimerase family protein [Paracoccaceae bacterium]